jgi:hypothetical protein
MSSFRNGCNARAAIGQGQAVGKHGVPTAVQNPLATYVDGQPIVVFRELINTRDNFEMAAPGVLKSVLELFKKKKN